MGSYRAGLDVRVSDRDTRQRVAPERCASHVRSPGRTCPLGEWGGKINRNVQYFYKDWYEPKDGSYEPTAGPGFGYELDEGKIKSRVEL